jgi:nucleoside-diphosphate-sugar epimerase
MIVSMALTTPIETKLRHVAVTGGTGFIGRRMRNRLECIGIAVTSFSRSGGVDILNDNFRTDGIDHLFHLAGLTYVPDSWCRPIEFYRVNSFGTLRVLEACRRSGTPLTYVSAYIYGTPSRLPISEQAPAHPNNPYAFSKLEGEHACRFYVEFYGVKASIVRIFNVYGPGQDSRFVIPTIARQVLNPKVDAIAVADLAPRRDYVYVDDVVDALLVAPTFAAGATFNIGSGVSHSVGDIVEACCQCAGVSKPVRETGTRRENEILDVIADISSIESACGWRPKTTFSSGIRSVLESIEL